MVRCGSKSGQDQDMCLEEFGLCAQNLITILGSIYIYIYGYLIKKESSL